MTKRLYIDTVGCQMNVLDSELVVAGLRRAGPRRTVTPAGVRQVFSAQVGNLAGVAVDDDGSLYFHLVDLIQFTGGAIFKAAPIPHVPGPQCALRSTRVVPSIPTVGLTSVTPLSSASVRVTGTVTGGPMRQEADGVTLRRSSAALSCRFQR